MSCGEVINAKNLEKSGKIRKNQYNSVFELKLHYHEVSRQIAIRIVFLTLAVIFNFISVLNKQLLLFSVPFRAMQFVQDAELSGKRKVDH